MHRTQYRFYIQRYPAGGKFPPKEDLEAKYECDYMRFTNLLHTGDVKNAYEEDFAEKSGVGKIYVPAKGDLAYKSYECKLKLLFKGEDALANANRFQDDMLGAKIEYSDNFRNVYATLLMTKSMEIDSERLYGGQQFVAATYTFTNIGGQTYETSQLISINEL